MITCVDIRCHMTDARLRNTLFMNGLQNLGLFLLLVLIAGCASVPGEPDPRDPLESYNRAMYKFNQVVDDAILKPVAKGYKAITPKPVDRGITNFFKNLADVTSALNNLFQFKLSRAGSDVGRLAVNTTIGVLGFFDVATNIGLPSYKEDFGQTFGYWGDDSSPYLVLPFLGLSTIRDTIGLGCDMAVNPLFYTFYNDNRHFAWGLVALDVTDTRADLLTASDILKEAAVDPYAFTRDAYLQHRRNKIFDGNPPEEEDDWEDESDEADTTADDE